MNEENINVDNTKLAEDVSEKIHFSFAKHFLVKPLEPVIVKKEFSKPVSKDDAPKTDKNGIEAVDYEDVETEIKEVESDYTKGIVLKVPFEYVWRMKDDKFPPAPIKVGDVIIFESKHGHYFDLFKDTKIVHPFDIVAISEQ